MTAKITLRIDHAHVARVLEERRRRGIGEEFKILPWWRRRDQQGRFVRGVTASRGWGGVS